MTLKSNPEGALKVAVKRRTMLVYDWGGTSIWLKETVAQRAIDRARARRGDGHGIAYIVRCRPKGARSCR